MKKAMKYTGAIVAAILIAALALYLNNDIGISKANIEKDARSNIAEELQDVKSVVKQIATETETDNLTLKEKATLAANLFQTIAAKRNIVLKLNKKTSKK